MVEEFFVEIRTKERRGWIDGCMVRWMDERMDRLTDGRMNLLIDGWVDAYSKSDITDPLIHNIFCYVEMLLLKIYL